MKADLTDTPHGSRTPAPEAAVALITCGEPETKILLLRRVHDERDPWSGHYAFPGGRRDDGDDTIYQTCVREVFEETGIVLDDNSLQRICAPSLAGRNVKAPMLVQPYVFRLSGRPAVRVEPAEIDSHVWLSLKSFMQLDRHRVIEVLPGMVRPVFPMDDYYVWGFTYGLLCRLFGVDSDLVVRRRD